MTPLDSSPSSLPFSRQCREQKNCEWSKGKSKCLHESHRAVSLMRPQSGIKNQSLWFTGLFSQELSQRSNWSLKRVQVDTVLRSLWKTLGLRCWWSWKGCISPIGTYTWECHMLLVWFVNYTIYLGKVNCIGIKQQNVLILTGRPVYTATNMGQCRQLPVGSSCSALSWYLLHGLALKQTCFLVRNLKMISNDWKGEVLPPDMICSVQYAMGKSTGALFNAA